MSGLFLDAPFWQGASLDPEDGQALAMHSASVRPYAHEGLGRGTATGGSSPGEVGILPCSDGMHGYYGYCRKRYTARTGMGPCCIWVLEPSDSQDHGVRNAEARLATGRVRPSLRGHSLARHVARR